MSTFQVVLKALVRHDGKILTLKRSPNAKFFAGYWDFPGGKLEHAEQIEKALEREILEETGLKASVGKILNAFSLTIEDETHTFLVFEAIPKKFDVKISFEHTDFKWVDVDFFKREKKVEPFIKNLIAKKLI